MVRMDSEIIRLSKSLKIEEIVYFCQLIFNKTVEFSFERSALHERSSNE